MQIHLVYEPDTSLAPAGFFTAMSFAAAQLDNLISDNITVGIDIDWNDSVLGEAGPKDLSLFGYSTVVAALQAHADSPAAIEAVDDLPDLDPTDGAGVYLSIAQQEALGLLTGTSHHIDGSATFGTGGAALDFSTTNLAVSGEIDFVGVAEHELTHALGRSGWGDGIYYSLMDLYRFAAPETVQTAPFSAAYFSIDDGQTDLADFSTVSDDYDWSTLANDSFDAFVDEGVANTISSVDETLLAAIGFDVACFCPGTRIATPDGEVPVERLAIGGAVLTREGVRRIKWIGRSAYEGRFLGDNPLMLPVTLAPGALGENLPRRPLTVSPGHGVMLGEVLVPAWRLVNGANVTQAPRGGTVAYLHIELEQHGLLCSEGCWSESYYAATPRSWFQNASEYDVLYPGEDVLGPPCLPRVEEGVALQALQRQVNRRAGLAPAREADAPLQGFVEIAGPEICAGWAYAGEAPVTLLVMRGGEILARVVANRYRADLRARGLGAGCHAFAVALPDGFAGEITLRRALDGAVLPLANAARAA